MCDTALSAGHSQNEDRIAGESWAQFPKVRNVNILRALPNVETEAIISNKCLVTKGTDGAIEVILYDNTLHQNTLG